ncbi:MAG TPA: hypothetical protein P5105_00910 [Victivallales bacterium]|nr:hypothetical protein [Victivallales bacterium]HPO90909.1 hypothetical protein [Victivallales bacterium]HRR05818.1 hypothetical protein [Victivallales bacterium]HRR28024.1 hypothetical protein [Victivallales bacterium]
MSFKKNIWVFPIILGFILRCLVILNNGPGPNYDSPASTDEVNYRELARNIYENKIFASWSEGFFTRSVRAPVYPAIIAFANFAFGTYSALLLNLLCDTMNIFLLYLLSRLLFSSPVAIITSFAYSIFAPSFLYLRFSTPEILSIFLILLLLISIIKYERFKSFYFLSVVVLYTLLIHTRPAFLPLLFLFPVILFFKFNSNAVLRRRVILSFSPMILILLLCFPWFLRNYLIHKTIVPVIVIPAWHTFESANTNISLEIQKTLDIIYAPDHKGWTEGEYFNYGRNKSLELFKKYHIKILFFGAYRIFRAWCFPDFYKRIFHPKAYFNPIYIYGKFFLLLIDFEGIVYLFLISLLFAILAKKRREIFCSMKKVIFEKLWLILFTFFYLGVHIIAIPFPQYRFLVEPIIMIFLFGLILNTLIIKNEKYSMLFENDRAPDCKFVNVLSIIISIIIFIPLVIPHSSEKVKYNFSSKESEGFLSYESLRILQWENYGLLPPVKGIIAGRIRYISHNFRFVESGLSPAVKDNSCSVGKLYVEENSPQAPFGKGDVKLNFLTKKIPDNNDYIICSGHMTNGIFRDLIMNVTDWKLLYEKK